MMMWRMACWVLLVAGPVLVGGLALRQERGASGASPSQPAQTAPEVTLRQIHMIETREGAKLWELRADRAEVHEREGYTVLSRERRPVEVTLYSSQGQLTCTASRATVDLKSKDVRLEGGVVARSDQGTELRTEDLRWLAASRRVQTDRPVTVSRRGLVSRGRGLEADTDLEQVRIFQNITSQLRSPASVPATGTGPVPR
jgi:LPS export ABC transporter protein LptC